VYSGLIETETLEPLTSDPRVVVIDVRYDLFDASRGRELFLAGHIPNARFADLNADLSARPGNGRGRHPLPSLAALEATFSSLGVSADSQVIAYDGGDGAYAARLWWLLRYLGHDAVAVLDGGFAKWTSEGRPVTTELPTFDRGVFVSAPRPGMLVLASELETEARSRTSVLVDSRAPDRFRGENETLDPVGGHIPGAVNRFFRTNVTQSGTFRSPSELREEFEHLLAATSPSESIFYCGSGVTACHNLLAMEHAGLPVGRLYAGSWSEWCSDESRPVARGDS
jgi:thiosulfate/3-mercaptopyruvate sulfurtransferase